MARVSAEERARLQGLCDAAPCANDWEYEFVEAVPGLLADLAAAEAELASVVRKGQCSYCGQVQEDLPLDPEQRRLAIAEHIVACPDNPVVGLLDTLCVAEARVGRLEEALRAAVRIPYLGGDCPVCAAPVHCGCREKVGEALYRLADAALAPAGDAAGQAGGEASEEVQESERRAWMKRSWLLIAADGEPAP